MAALRAGKTRSASYQRLSIALADSSVKVPVGSMTWTRLLSAGVIWPIFSSKVMRESRSATRSSMGRLGLLYFGVLSDAAAFGALSCEIKEMEQSTMRQSRERGRISIFLMRGRHTSWGNGTCYSKMPEDVSGN